MYSSEIRTFEDFENRSSYEYFSTLVLMPERNNEHFTGTYICQKVDDPESQTYYHLYFSGKINTGVIYHRKHFLSFGSDSYVIHRRVWIPNNSK